jgi:hypothetical protein
MLSSLEYGIKDALAVYQEVETKLRDLNGGMVASGFVVGAVTIAAVLSSINSQLVEINQTLRRP